MPDFNITEYVRNAQRPPLLDLLTLRPAIMLEKPDFLIPLRRGVEVEGHAQIFRCNYHTGPVDVSWQELDERRRHALGTLYRMMEIELLQGKPHSLPPGGLVQRRTAGVLWLGSLGPYDPTKLRLGVMRRLTHTTIAQTGAALFLCEVGLTMAP